LNNKDVEYEEIKIDENTRNEAANHYRININKPHHRRTTKEPYVTTIPIVWIASAAKLKGKAIHVGIILWYLSGVSKNDEVTIPRKLLEQFGIHRETCRRAVIELEDARLITVHRTGRKRARITIVKNFKIQETD